MEIQYHPLQGIRWMMYDIIVFQNLRCRLSKTCVFGARKRRLIVDGRQYWDTFLFLLPSSLQDSLQVRRMFRCVLTVGNPNTFVV